MKSFIRIQIGPVFGWEWLYNNTADMAPIGSLALANPDVVGLLKNGSSLNESGHATLYSGNGNGDIDYPFFR